MDSCLGTVSSLVALKTPFWMAEKETSTHWTVHGHIRSKMHTNGVWCYVYIRRAYWNCNYSLAWPAVMSSRGFSMATHTIHSGVSSYWRSRVIATSIQCLCYQLLCRSSNKHFAFKVNCYGNLPSFGSVIMYTKYICLHTINSGCTELSMYVTWYHTSSNCQLMQYLSTTV